MKPFAAPSDLVAYVGELVTLDRAAALLTQASEIIRGLARQQIDMVTDDVVILDPIGSVVLLPELPVVAVTALEVRDGADWSPYPDRWVWSASGTIRAAPSRLWPTEPQSVRVTNSHGYDPIPGDLAAVCLTLAVRLAGNPMRLQSQQIGAVRVQFESSRGSSALLDDAETRIIDRYSLASVA